jgi:hypothetical protein
MILLANYVFLVIGLGGIKSNAPVCETQVLEVPYLSPNKSLYCERE